MQGVRIVMTAADLFGNAMGVGGESPITLQIVNTKTNEAQV
jgi:hypothetical protein